MCAEKSARGKNKIMNTMENTFENRRAEKIKNIFDDARDKPHKYGRLILTKDYAAFHIPGRGSVEVNDAVITIHKGEKTTVVHFVPGQTEAGAIAAIRNNKHIAYAVFKGEETIVEELFENKRKDRVQAHSSFFVMLGTNIGTIALICDSNSEMFFYSEFTEISEEPSFYNAMIRTLTEASRKEAEGESKNGQA